jgi:hypothetical protein
MELEKNAALIIIDQQQGILQPASADGIIRRPKNACWIC